MAVEDILHSHDDDLHVDALAEVIRATVDCAAHCEACADACLEEGGDMTRCIRANLDCADICKATASVVGRAGRSGAPWLELVEVCQAACSSCAAECESQGVDHCDVCAGACRRCETACADLLKTVRG